MLLGYDENGDIKFIFTDDDYLKSKFPNNTARISNFWKVKDHGLKELFIDDFSDLDNIHQYKVIDDRLIKKEECEIDKQKKESCDIINATAEVKIAKQELMTERKDISKIDPLKILSGIVGFQRRINDSLPNGGNNIDKLKNEKI